MVAPKVPWQYRALAEQYPCPFCTSELVDITPKPDGGWRIVEAHEGTCPDPSWAGALNHYFKEQIHGD